MVRTSLEYRKAVAALYGGSPRTGDRALALLWALLVGLLAAVSIYKSAHSGFWILILLMFQAASIGPNLPDPAPQDIPLKTLEDRADFRFGKAFDELTPAQQELLLGQGQQNRTLFAPLEPGLKYPNLLPDLAYLGKLQRARRIALFGLLALVSAHFAVLLLPRLPFVANCLDQARPAFWCIFGALLLPLLFLVWRGPRRLESGE